MTPYNIYTLLFVLLLVVGALVVVLTRILISRVRKTAAQSSDLNSMMKQALDMGNYHIIIYDLRTHVVKNIHGALLPSGGMSVEELINRIDPDQRDEFRENVQALARGEVEHWTMTRRWNTNLDGGEPKWQTFYGSAILEREDGEPRYIFHAFKDITREVREQQHNQEMTAIYMKVFE